MPKRIQDRLVRFTPELIDNNLELDFLSHKTIDFATFPTQELVYTVASFNVDRISLISNEVYGSVNYWWLLALRNDIIDPFTQLYVGQQIFVPSLLDYYDFYNKNIIVKDTYDDFVFSKRKLT